MTTSLKPFLLSGEEVIWEGSPHSGLIFRPLDAVMIPFSVLWCGFVLFGITSLWEENTNLQTLLFGMIFVAAGLYMTVGRFVLDTYIRRTLTYFITNKRVIIARGAAGSKLKSLDIKRLPLLELDEKSDGSGTIRFGSGGGAFAANNFGIWQPTFDPTPQFIRVQQARSLYVLIQKQSET